MGVSRHRAARDLRTAWILLAAALAPWAVSPAQAADVTDVVDAADGDDPFDLSIKPRFTQTLERSLIRREYPCDPDATQQDLRAYPRLDTRCAEPSVVFRKEMEAERDINRLDVDVQIGLYKDVELHMTLPYVFSDQRRLKFATGDRDVESVTADNSSVDPADARVESDIRNNVTSEANANDLNRQYFSTYRLFSLAGDGNEGPSRAGFGDMKVGLAWNPFNDQRDDTKATLKLQFDYTIPTGEVAKAGNEGVGRGLHELQWTIASSKRFRYLEPYFSVSYILPVPAGNSLFDKLGAGQNLTSPGQRAEILFGSEFIPYEEADEGRKFAIDIGFLWGFTSEGRDYSPLFEALSSSQCNGLTPNEIRDAINAVRDPAIPDTRETINRAACRWILDQPGNADGSPVYNLNAENVGDLAFSHNGITDHEAYATFGANVGLLFQPNPYVGLKTRFRLQHQQEHFLTAARTGRDSGDENDTVKFDDPNERNPAYNPTLDSVGNRFRMEESLIFSWDVGLAVQF
jgi:hypothetical protein